MKILRLSIKPEHALPMLDQDKIRLRSGLGISKDANSDCTSPRQVLLVDRDVYSEFGLPSLALRENLLVDGRINAVESGGLLRIGDALLRVTIPCEPCVKLRKFSDSLPREILGKRGMLARVIRGGTISKNMDIEVLSERMPSIPSSIQERLEWVLSKTNAGQVATTVQFTKILGVPRTYVRVLPRLLKALPVGSPSYRVITVDLGMLGEHLPDQAYHLASEGLAISTESKLERIQEIVDPYSPDEVQAVSL